MDYFNSEDSLTDDMLSDIEDDFQVSLRNDVDICRKIREVETGDTIKHALKGKSKKIADYVWKQWCQYSKGMEKADPLQHLKEMDKIEERCFLRWRLETGRMTKLSSVLVSSRHLRMMYKHQLGERLHIPGIDDVKEFIRVEMKNLHDLEESTDVKDVANADDMFLLLCHHWKQSETIFPIERCRIQLSLYILLACATGSRPSLFIDREDCLKYKDLILSKVRDPNQPTGQKLLLMLDNRLQKGQKNESEPIAYVLMEVDSPLAFDIVSHVVALAFDDDAFDSKHIRKPEDLFVDEIPKDMDSLELNWKDSIRDTPLIRRAIRTPRGPEISRSQAEVYDTINTQVRNLGQEVGFVNWTKLYIFRRGAGEAMDPRVGERIISDARRNRALGHGSSEVFNQFYTSRFAPDIQSAFLGRPSDQQLYQLATHMRLRRNPRAKIEVQKKMEGWKCEDDEYLELDIRYQNLRRKLLGRPIIGSKYKAKLEELKRKRDAIKVRCKKQAHREAWKSFFAHSGTLEIERQRCGVVEKSSDGLLNSDFSKEREILARCLFQQPLETDTAGDRRKKRLECISAMISLCRQRDNLPKVARRSRRLSDLVSPKQYSSGGENCCIAGDMDYTLYQLILDI
ncbi:hypothetical protein AOL_s00091g1 [Orbilia oligospora ATCC 24927]|uniref:Uncharacterized protein n=1 Tax=Arthrobotrys oligospora (strain ATCC 24927 / CBS 115.81 / DSM 1491) TaxID=756982 RepID=G1XHU9_ARTOA|nr:hypothetical protein AOL_s00091g1 [Orbilia oligospora ATCC 24927]EGX47257.1 hypothetical protein AOL_s00091g1 [Orbilia oligospora ATCC 24927]